MIDLKAAVKQIKHKPPVRNSESGVVVGGTKNNSVKHSKKLALVILCLFLVAGGVGLACWQYRKRTADKNNPGISNQELERKAERHNELISAKKYIEEGDVSKLTDSIIKIQSKTDSKTDIDLQYVVFMTKFLAKDYTSAKSELAKLKTIKNENPNQMSIFVLQDTISQYEEDLEFKSLTQEYTDAKAE